MKFHLMIRGRDCRQYLKECLDSLVNQTFPNWHGMILLDKPHSKDEYHIAMTYAGLFPDKFDVECTGEHVGLCANLFLGIRQYTDRIRQVDPEDGVAIVDADDRLEPEALDVVAEKYRQNPRLLLTYGSYTKASLGRKTKISKPYDALDNVRVAPWHASHLKTFKWKLYDGHIGSSHFKDSQGKWLRAASDLALMFPLMELAGLDRCAHVKKAIYWWRDNTPYKTNRDSQIECEKIIRAKPKMERLP